MSKLSTKAASALAVTKAGEIKTLQQSAVAQLAAVAQLEGRVAGYAIMAGITLKRVKLSLPHGEFQAWQRSIREQIPTTGRHLPSIAMCQFYMRLAEVFLTKTKAPLPPLLALPGDTLSLELPDSGDTRAFVEKLTAFVAEQSLNDLLDRYKIKERQVPQGSAATGGNLGAPAAPATQPSPLQQLEAERKAACTWYQQQVFTWKENWVRARSFKHLPDEATQDGELTLPQFIQLLDETKKAAEAEAKARAKK
jgi:hypothetical protein